MPKLGVFARRRVQLLQSLFYNGTINLYRVKRGATIDLVKI